MPGPNRNQVTIHGVQVDQLQLQGKWYTPVDARVKIAEHADPSLVRRNGAGYHVVSVQFVQLGERWVYHCLVEYPAGSGVVKPGSDTIDLKDPSGVAKAETSAIGRALGLHGIAIEESIASAEEMSRVEPAAAQEFDEGERVVDSPQERHPQTHSQQRSAQRSSTAPEPLSSYQQRPPKHSLRDRMKDLGFVDDKTQWRPWVMEVTGKSEEQLWGAGGGTTPEDMQKLKEACERLEAKASQAQ